MIVNIDSNSTIIDGDYPDLEQDLINSEDGTVEYENQWITINFRGEPLTITFGLEAQGSIIDDKGDYYTPPYLEAYIKHIKVNIVSVESDGLSLSYDKKMMENFIKNFFL